MVVGGASESLPFLRSNFPVLAGRGHLSDVVDVAWSRLHFLLSCSLDKTVRLWHVSGQECLQSFAHPDGVTAVQFHPLKVTPHMS